ncbi:hypothetical protein ZWY2020_028211 [Hordeum vulgare]|nr:hypothetical protein ZWY2020_028211 [Hordeum vulgare]
MPKSISIRSKGYLKHRATKPVNVGSVRSSAPTSSLSDVSVGNNKNRLFWRFGDRSVDFGDLASAAAEANGTPPFNAMPARHGAERREAWMLFMVPLRMDIAFFVHTIEIKTSPADFRFPTTNQTRHCFTRYVEFHRCVSAKGDEAAECDKFAKYYRSLCPN